VLHIAERRKGVLKLVYEAAFRGDPARGQTFHDVLDFSAIENRGGHRNMWADGRAGFGG
jgi:hypothetical protein